MLQKEEFIDGEHYTVDVAYVFGYYSFSTFTILLVNTRFK